MDYRLYFLNDRGHITDRVDLDCEDDDHAAQVAATYVDGRDMELWSRDRKVREFPSREA
jgi:hypothetical protein